MKINQNPYDGMHLGKFADERAKILKEVSLDPDKMDGFMRSASPEDDMTLITLNLGDMKRKSKGGKGGAVSGDRDITFAVDMGKIKKNAQSFLRKLKKVKSLEMEGYMIPATKGKVSHLCLTYGSLGDGKTAENYHTAMKTFIEKMTDAKFTILTSTEGGREELQRMVNEWAKKGEIKNPERVKIINTGQHLSIWAQDSTLVVGNQVVEQDRMWFPGWGDGTVASELAKANPELEHRKMEGIFIDGGNQVATEDTIFAGSDVIAFMVKDMRSHPSKYSKIQGDLKIDEATVNRVSQEELCKLMVDRTFPHQKVVIIGHKGEQPAFHIDMAMTPLGKVDPETGKEVITVGDPLMAVHILNDIKAKSPNKYKEYQKSIQSKIDYSPSKPLDTLVDALKDDTALQENFDAVAKGLEAEGYKVERLPYLGSSSLRNVPWITYNNGVIDGDNFFIPNFGIPELDDMANGVYKKYGYNPVPVDMNAISSLQGAINCITKVIERDYSEK